jgi:cell division protein FtsW (lipid II flippase)
MINKDSFNKVDMFLLVTVIFTISFGILMIYSAGFDPVMKVNSGLYKKQIIWFIIGIIFFLVMTTLRFSDFCNNSYPAFREKYQRDNSMAEFRIFFHTAC